MARIDSILAMLKPQGANELRVGTDRKPKLLSFGNEKQFSMQATDAETLRDLLGDLLSPERQELLNGKGRVDFMYEAPGLGGFQVGMAMRSSRDGFDVTFLKSARVERRPPPVAPAAVANAEPTPNAPPDTIAQQPYREVPVDVRLPPPRELVSRDDLDFSDTDKTYFDGLVAHAAALRASDIHLAAGESPRARIDGKLIELDFPCESDPVDELPIDAAARERVARGESVDLGIEVKGTGRVRLHVFRTSTGVAAAVRLLPQLAPSIASLHMPIPLEPLVELNHGLILICGATGSGKSTTLAALCQEVLRRRSVVLTTLEDPIEYQLTATASSILRRREIGRDVADFASGIRDALREDPDVVLIGELRDEETIANALTAAETGHLVLASLHSSGAASAIERIVDAFPPLRHDQVRQQLADSLRAVVAQRLLPRLKGTGRIPCIEVLRGTHGVAALIREGKTVQLQTAMQSGKSEGMITLERCLADRVIAREIRPEDARAVANDQVSLTGYLPK